MEMRTTSLWALSGQAWRQTATLLFRPFRLGLWLKLWLIAWLAGYLAGGTGLNYHSPRTRAVSRQANAPTATRPTAKDGAEASRTPSSTKTAIRYENVRKWVEATKRFISTHQLLTVLVILGLIVCGLWWDWLSARFSLIFVEAIRAGVVHIREPFQRFRDLARTLFWWRVGFGAVGSTLGLVCIWRVGHWLLAHYAQMPELPLQEFFLQQWKPLVGFLLPWMLGVWLPMLVIGVWVQDFVVALMHEHKSNVITAWRTTLHGVTGAPLEAVKYLLWRLLMVMLIWVAMSLVFIVLAVIVALLAVLLGLLGYVLIKFVPVLKLPLIIVGILGLVVVAVGGGVLSLLLGVPVAVWLRVFSLRYLEAHRLTAEA